MEITDFLKRAGEHCATDAGWSAACPACRGEGALRVAQRHDGGIWIECLEGCGYGQILKAMGVSAEDVGGENVEVVTRAEGGAKKRVRKPLDIVARHDYQEPGGAIIYQVCVCADGTSRLRVPDPGNAHQWKWGRGRWGVPAVPYRLPAVIAAVRDGVTVWIVPTERDVEEMERAGLVATCCLADHDKKDAAGEWQKEFCGWFAGARKFAVILARKDPAPKPNDMKAAMASYKGQKRAERIRLLMEDAGVRTKTLVLPDRDGVRICTPAEWFAAGGTKEELIVAVKACPPWVCPDGMDALSLEQLQAAAAEVAPGAAMGGQKKPAASSSLSSPLTRQEESDLNDMVFLGDYAPLPPLTPKGKAENVGGLADDDPRSVASLRGTFIAILTNKELDVMQKRSAMEVAIIVWLTGRGKLFYHRELKTISTAMFFDAVDKRLSYLSRDYFRSWLSLAMRLSTESGDYRYIVARVGAEAIAGRRTDGIVPERFWARRDNSVYLSCGNGRMVRCTAAGAEVVDVGTDKVLFEEGNECHPWTLQAGDGEDPFESCEVFRTMNAIYPRGKMLFKLWAMSIPGHGEKTRPILLLTGKGRSGKTVLALMLMELFGIPAKATMVSKDYKITDFWTLADAGGVMCLDNADSYTDWLPNCLCTVATCGSFSKKMNYKDNELITQRANCWCCVTGTTPHFAAEHTVADRLLTVELFSRASDDTKGSSLKDDIMARRDAGLTWICRAWCRALADETAPPSAVNARHPDWGASAYRLARAVGMEDKAVEAMTESEASKAVFSLRNDALGTYIIDAFAEAGFCGSTSEICEALKARCDSFDGEKTWTLPKIGKALKRLEDPLVVAFGMQKANHSGVTKYTFDALPVQLAPPTMLRVEGLRTQSTHTGDHAHVSALPPPTPPTPKDLFGGREEEEWNL